MKVLMISIDKGLLGSGQLGDVIERHRKYGEYVERLDIVVLCGPGQRLHEISGKVTAYPTNSKNRWFYYFSGKKIAKNLASRHNYDLIVTQDPFVTGLIGVAVKRKFKKKLLVHFHGDFWRNQKWLEESKVNYLFYIISKYVVWQSNAIRVVSAGIKDKLVQAGVGANKITILPTLVNIKQYWRADLEDSVKDPFLVVHVSRYDKVKDFPMLGKAFKIIKGRIADVKLLQVGGGPRAAKEINDPDAEVLPLMSHGDLTEVFHRAAVVVLCSTSESLGKVLIEANASKTPVVATSTTGAKEIIEEGINGFLVQIGDHNALAEKVITLIENPELAQSMGEKGFELVNKKFNFSAEDVTKFWSEVVNS